MKNTLRMAILSILLVIGLNTSLNAQTTRSAATYAELTSAYTNSVDNDIINITNNIVVAAPVLVALRISRTGLPSVPVKYSVRRSIDIASPTPTAVARNGLHQPPGSLFM